MFEAATYRLRRRRKPDGIGYEIRMEGEPILAWTRRTADLSADFDLSTPAGDPVLRLTTENLVPDVGAAFTVIDVRADEVLGLIRRNWRSVVRREFGLLDRYGLEFANAASRSRLLHVARNQFIKLVPYWYRFTDGDGRRIGSFRGAVRGGGRLDLADIAVLDPRMAVGTAVAIDAVEMFI